MNEGLLERPCMGGRKGRNGLFPASACIKLDGKFGELFQSYFKNFGNKCKEKYTIYHLSIKLTTHRLRL